MLKVDNVKKQNDFQRYIHTIKDDNFDVVVQYIGNASVVLLGEATHGTHEFYHARAHITKRLIMEKGFTTIAIEGDWPDTYRINRYINHEGSDQSAIESLAEFKRFPAWMWRNEVVVSLIKWLYAHNASVAEQSRVSFYGLDLYSLHQSIEIVIKELQKIDPAAAIRAQQRYRCFDAYLDPQEYGCKAALFPDKSCRQEVIKQLIEVKAKELDFFKNKKLEPRTKKFYLEQNALVIKNAERYYTSLFEGDQVASWNIRDQHMMETVQAILTFNTAIAKNNKLIIWAHNSHLGDARATQMASYGEINLGQLIKETFDAQAVAIGFTTFTGTVSAASAWGGDVQRKYVRPALKESVEFFFHSLHAGTFALIPSEYDELYDFFEQNDFLERAIGVVYVPETERESHYFYAQIAKQFDIIIHYDVTEAVIPLEKSTEWEQADDVPETFPFGV
jgi:erythromycin esterase-like protein